MMKVAVVLASAGLVASAQAASTNIVFETSVNGGAYSAGLVQAAPGDQVRVQMRVVLDNSVAPVSVLGGLSGITLFVNADDFAADDALMPFSATQGFDSTLGGYPPGGPGNLGGASAIGRPTPFGSIGSAINPTATLGGGVMTFGHPSGTGGRLAIGQLGGGNAFDAVNGDSFLDASLNPVVFRFGFTVGAAFGRIIDVTGTDVLNNRGTWYANTASATLVRQVTMGTISPAQIEIVPSPASLALLGLGGLVAGRRRR